MILLWWAQSSPFVRLDVSKVNLLLPGLLLDHVCVCVCVSVCMWVCDSSCMLPLYTQQEIVCAHVFICLCAHASKQFLHYGHSHTIKCNNICKTNDQQMLLKWQACIKILKKSWDFEEYYVDTILQNSTKIVHGSSTTLIL